MYKGCCVWSREIVDVKAMFPSFGPEDFPKCHEHAQRALLLAKLALEANPDSPEAQRDLIYAEAAAIRFRDGSERNPERYNAEVAYGHALRDAGVLGIVASTLRLTYVGQMEEHLQSILQPCSNGPTVRCF